MLVLNPATLTGLMTPKTRENVLGGLNENRMEEVTWSFQTLRQKHSGKKFLANWEELASA